MTEGMNLMRTFVLLFALLIGMASPARAADDISAAQSTIRAQVDAIGRDDADAAFGFAASTIQGMFGTAGVFMTMVRKGYAPIYRHQKFEFGEGRVADGKIAQQVHIIDADGVPWEALYTLEQQPDGSLKISGCVLLKAGTAV